MMKLEVRSDEIRNDEVRSPSRASIDLPSRRNSNSTIISRSLKEQMDQGELLTKGHVHVACGNFKISISVTHVTLLCQMEGGPVGRQVYVFY